MDFGKALEVIRAGERAQRVGWNGKGMYIYLQLFGVPFEPAIVMFTADKKHQPGWLASQADMLADDWQICLKDDKEKEASDPKDEGTQGEAP